MRWMNNQWGTQIVGPDRGGGPAAQAVAANQVQLTRFGVGNFLGVMQAGKVKALAVSTAKRLLALPDVPTFAEVGWAVIPVRAGGVAVPKGTPQTAVSRLEGEFQKLFDDPEVHGVPGQAGRGAGGDRPDRFHRVPQAGPQGRLAKR